jgi:pyruvate dehydrogenase E2 component (dihydrolipoamide acetyltransferase)
LAVTEVVMPSMGADMTEGAIARWIKTEGDEIFRGDILAEVETDKAVVEMEAYGNGILRQVIIGEGVTVPVGQVIAIIADADEEIPSVDAPVAEAAPEPAAAPVPVAAQAAPEPVAAAAAPAGRIKASPVAKKMAAENGIDLASVSGTGPGGRVVKSDLEAAIAGGGSPAPAAATPAAASAPAAPVAAAAPAPALLTEDIPLTSMRKAIARTVVRSKLDQPDFWVSVSVEMSAALAARKQMNDALADSGVRVSVNDMILKAVALSIEKHPKWNMSYTDEKLVAHPNINVGVAIALDQGLMVPAILGCQAKSLKDIAIASKDLGARAKSGGLTQEEMTGGTFSVSNLGMFGIDEFSAIIFPPQPGILAVGASAPTPIVKDGELAVGNIMKMTLSVDHRVNDGAEGAVFINEIKGYLENPLSMVL